MSDKVKIAVVGSGPAGRAAAWELQKIGFDVSVFEASDHVGGRASTITLPEFPELPVDIGANFFTANYRDTAEYCREFGLENSWQPTSQTDEHYTVRDGRLCLLSMNSIWSIFKFEALSFVERIKLLWMFWQIKGYGKLNFFDLTSVPLELNTGNAYDYVEANVGKDAADYVIDAFTRMYQFHGAKDMSLAAMFALVNMIANNTSAFIRYHTFPGQMSMLPEAMAKRLNIRTSYPIDEVKDERYEVVVRSGKNTHTFDKVVIATTADVTKKIYKNPNQKQKDFLDSVRYASTINVSFRVDKELLEGIACVAVPFKESRIISEYTNESTKGIVSNGKTLVNIGLHEEAANHMIYRSDQEIFNIVAKELAKVCPPLKGVPMRLRNHYVHRWPSAMPKFSQEFVSKVREFWKNGQGDNNVYFAGDYLGYPWVEGAFRSGKRVAKLIQMGIAFDKVDLKKLLKVKR